MHTTSIAPADRNALATRCAIGRPSTLSNALSRPIRVLRPPVRTAPLQRSPTGANGGEIGQIRAVEVLRWTALQQIGHDVRLDGPVHDRSLVGGVSRMLRVLPPGVEEEIDQAEKVADLVAHDGRLDPAVADQRCR